MIEFTFVGIPLIFVLISVFEMARGMWIYHTLAHALREGTRYAVVHGANCDTPPNTCATVTDTQKTSAPGPLQHGTVQYTIWTIREAGVGLLPGELNVWLHHGDPGSSTSCAAPACISCAPISTCLNDTTRWPAKGSLACAGCDNTPGSRITIRGTIPFRSAIAMLWPGAGGFNFPVYTFPASSTDRIQF